MIILWILFTVFRTWNQVLFWYINGKGLIINCLYKRAVDNGTTLVAHESLRNGDRN